MIAKSRPGAANVELRREGRVEAKRTDSCAAGTPKCLETCGVRFIACVNRTAMYLLNLKRGIKNHESGESIEVDELDAQILLDDMVEKLVEPALVQLLDE